MKNSSLPYLKCVRCVQKLQLEILIKNSEINEGFLLCKKCKLTFPIIQKIPILWDDFEAYIKNRPKLGGELLLSAKTKTMKSFLKDSLSKSKKPREDKSKIEQRWSSIYQKSNKSKFYQIISTAIKKLKPQKFVLEHGCSIGIISNNISKNNELIFGIDRSFYAIKIAKQNQNKNCDYFVADSQYHPFGNQKFDLILCLNMLELLEPRNFLKMLSKQISKGTLVLSDPYDFDRGKNSVKNPIDSTQLRNILKGYNFQISTSTKKPSYIPWNLTINPRTKLQYKVDLVIGNKK